MGEGDRRREREREAEARAAAAPATAARWLVLADDGPPPVVAVDVVGELLALHPRTTLRSREGDRLRTLAGAVEGLVGQRATCPSGTPLLEVLVDDPATRELLVPDEDAGLMALLEGESPTRRTADRTIRLAEALVAAAAAHRAGDRDLVAAVAPPLPRHPTADEVDAVVAVGTEGLGLPASPAPAVSEVGDGWLGASPVELFLAVGRGAVAGRVAEVVGEALARWLAGWVRGPDDWRQPLLDRMHVDADGLLQESAARAGSDHPAVVGPVLCELVALRHPVG